MKPDVIVVGAGAAGLAAAAELARQGWRVLLLEARGRIGGRVFSTQPPGWTVPVELGAEFVHGGNRLIRRLLKRAGRKTRALAPAMWFRENGRLGRRADYWDRIARVAGRIPRRDRGWSFAQFLRREHRKIPAADRQLVAAYVGSFNAAPIARISAHAVRAHHAGADTTDQKLRGRYDAILRAMVREWPARRVELRLKAVVHGIQWRCGGVSVRVGGQGKRFATYQARAVVVTLPLGVLRANRVKFSPPLAARQRLFRRAGWGQVVRVVIRFRRGFWSAPFLPRGLASRNGRNFGFVNAPGELLPVWWALDAPAPVLTGWAGGEIAERFRDASRRELRRAAVASLAHIFGTTRRAVDAWVADFLVHDWRHDPFALGAYSYPVAGGGDIPERLAEPVQDTLFFAGEALAEEYGTVHGALDSGRQAARRVAGILEAERRRL